MKHSKRQISASIIADSINPDGERATTFVLTFPRIILAELNTHRAFSRNSASSRAIPFKKMLKSVMSDPFIPIAWMKDHSGMQGSQYFSGFKAWLLRRLWLMARTFAVLMAMLLNKLGLTKQIVNRLLEPFLWHTAIVTATEYENFFALRAHEAAEIHIDKLAQVMLFEYNESTPKQLTYGQWHIPFGDNMKEPKLWSLMQKLYGEGLPQREWALKYRDLQIKIATARCARVSYVNFDGTDDYEADVKLYDRLSQMGHWSPFEHCAVAAIGRHGNFNGWKQLRQTFDNENKSDTRVVKK